MATECFARGATHTCVNELCCLVGLGEGRTGIVWAMNPELAIFVAQGAGGVDGAWPGQQWTMEEFEAIVRSADEQVVNFDHKSRCLVMSVTGRCEQWEALQ